MALAKEEPALELFNEEDASAVTRSKRADSNMTKRTTIPVANGDDDPKIPDGRIVEFGE